MKSVNHILRSVVVAVSAVLISTVVLAYGPSAQAFNPRAPTSTVQQIKQAAKGGDPDAQYALGYMYYYGQQVRKDMSLAKQWIRRAAAQGQQRARTALGMLGEPSPVAHNPERKRIVRRQVQPRPRAIVAANTVARNNAYVRPRAGAQSQVALRRRIQAEQTKAQQSQNNIAAQITPAKISAQRTIVRPPFARPQAQNSQATSFIRRKTALRTASAPRKASLRPRFVRPRVRNRPAKAIARRPTTIQTAQTRPVKPLQFHLVARQKIANASAAKQAPIKAKVATQAPTTRAKFVSPRQLKRVQIAKVVRQTTPRVGKFQNRRIARKAPLRTRNVAATQYRRPPQTARMNQHTAPSIVPSRSQSINKTVRARSTRRQFVKKVANFRPRRDLAMGRAKFLRRPRGSAAKIKLAAATAPRSRGVATQPRPTVAAAIAAPKTVKAKKISVATKSPVTKPATHGLTTAERQLLGKANDHYTLQVLGSHNLPLVQEVLSANHLENKAAIYHTYLKDKDWYVLVYGDFQNPEDALAAIDQLPPTVQHLNPWVKPFASVKLGIRAAKPA